MESIGIKHLWLFMFFALQTVRSRGEDGSYNDVVKVQENVTFFSKVGSANRNDEDNNTCTTNAVVSNDKRKNIGGSGSGDGGGGGGGGGGFSLGWGGGGGGGGWGSGGGGGGGGGDGWGWGGGGGGYWRWGSCGRQFPRGRNHNLDKREGLKSKDYLIGEFAQCMDRGRCGGMRLDCPQHCGGPCFYDCRYMCKPHCKR